MQKSIQNHPSIIYASDVNSICRPLLHLNITYFAHVCIKDNTRFSAITNNPSFTEHYITNQYYNADIHLANKSLFNKYVIWDSIERAGLSKKMHEEASLFGVKHTFTIMKEKGNEKHYFHFANNSNERSINQIYLENIDLLESYTQFFIEKVNESTRLKKVYEFEYEIAKDAAGYIVTDHQNLLASVNRKNFRNDLMKFQTSLPHFTNREKECLALYIRGKTAKEISFLLGISKRTVEGFLAAIKTKMSAASKSELFSKVFENNYYSLIDVEKLYPQAE